MIWEFEKLKKIIIDDIDVTTHNGKHQRGELLVKLKDRAGLTYKEISQFDVFGDVHLDTLRDLYRRMKAKGKREEVRSKKKDFLFIGKMIVFKSLTVLELFKSFLAQATVFLHRQEFSCFKKQFSFFKKQFSFSRQHFSRTYKNFFEHKRNALSPTRNFFFQKAIFYSLEQISFTCKKFLLKENKFLFGKDKFFVQDKNFLVYQNKFLVF